jgi:glycosyltransferase involved in cell wall biosynthesis
MNADARLVVLADFTPRGDRTMDRFFFRFGEAMRARNWPVRMLFYASPPPSYASALRALGIEWGVAPFPLSRNPVAFWRALGRDSRPTILQTHFVSPFDPVLLATRATGRVRWLEVVDHSSNPVTHPVGLRQALRGLRGAVATQLLDEVIAVSDFVARRLEALGLAPNRLRTIHNGIDSEDWPARSGPRRPGPPRLCYAGRLDEEKGIRVLQAAFEQLERTVPGIELFIAGAGPESTQLERWAAGRAVRLLGTVQGLGQLFRDTDVLLVPTLSDEAFGLVAAEALASEAAVVVSSVGGLPEVVGACGRLCPPGDARALAEAAKELCTDLEKAAHLGREGRARVLDRFTLARTVANYVNAVSQLASDARSSTILGASAH